MRQGSAKFCHEPVREGDYGFKDAYLLNIAISSNESQGQFVLGLVCEHESPARFNEFVVRTQLIRGLFQAWQNSRLVAEASSDSLLKSSLYVLELLEEMVGRKSFQHACLSLVNTLVSKVCLGWRKGNYIKTRAISLIESFDRHSEEVIEVENLFEEAADQEKIIQYPRDSERLKIIDYCHRKHMKSKGLEQVFTIPMLLEGECVGALSIEKIDEVMNEKEIELIHVALQHCTFWLHDKHLQSLWLPARILEGFRRSAQWWLGPNQTMLKFGIIAAMVLLVASAILEFDHRLEAVATLETDQVTYLSAPFDGIVKEIQITQGDQVQAGQKLLGLGVEELELRELEQQARLVRHEREIEKSRSEGKLVDMKLAQAKVEQTRAELSLTEYYLNSARGKFRGTHHSTGKHEYNHRRCESVID